MSEVAGREHVVMRIRVFSDLHFEFHRDRGQSLLLSLDEVPCDVVVLAGDVSDAAGLGDALDLFCAHFRDVPVVYVHGNHEFYGSAREPVLKATDAAVRRNQNLKWLDGAAFDVGGVRFLGAPLWFAHPGKADALRLAMNDFHQIQGFDTWVYDENARHVAFFERELGPNTIAVTHYLPSYASVAPQFAGHPLNPFFVCDLEALVLARRPPLWIHGHTHATIDARVGETHIVCNPFGYVRVEENAGFSTLGLFTV